MVRLFGKLRAAHPVEPHDDLRVVGYAVGLALGRDLGAAEPGVEHTVVALRRLGRADVGEEPVRSAVVILRASGHQGRGEGRTMSKLR